MLVHVINGKWTVNGKTYCKMSNKDKELLSKAMAFKKEAYEAHHKPKRKINL